VRFARTRPVAVDPVKVQQHTSGECWRIIARLADFAIVCSYLSTATKWGIDVLDALTRLFTDVPRLSRDGPWFLASELPSCVRLMVKHRISAPGGTSIRKHA
jgi:hypothetical protein